MTPDLARDEAFLQRVSQAVYGQTFPTDQISVGELHAHFSSNELISVDNYIQKLADHGLVEYSAFQQAVQRTLRGKHACDLDCVCEIVLGFPYVDSKYREAVFHVILDKDNQEEAGGSAFSCTDFSNMLVTARHVIEDYPIKRIENHAGAVVDFRVTDRIFPDDPSLDLAFIVLDQLDTRGAFRVAWDSVLPEHAMMSSLEPAGRRGEPVVIFGFPPTPWHHASLFNFTAEIESRSRNYRLRESLILSKSRPGCSGGPVVDHRGMVVGIVSTSSNRARSSQNEKIQERLTNEHVDFIAAIPSAYLSEVQRTIGNQ
jgi:S1-C subfamily serine protease